MHILIIEDDKEIARLTSMYLQCAGYQTTVICNGRTAINTIRELSPDLILLDLMLPEVNGEDICKQAREFYSGPIIILTAKEADINEVVLLKIGADDYIRKPSKSCILLARIEALLRRTKMSSHDKVFDMNYEALSVTVDNKRINLTNSEFDLLALLLKKTGKVVSREECIELLRGISYDISDRSIDMRISGLRRKLNDSVRPYKLIKTIRNRGYTFVKS